MLWKYKTEADLIALGKRYNEIDDRNTDVDPRGYLTPLYFHQEEENIRDKVWNEEFPHLKNKRRMHSNIDILVATPSRLEEHMLEPKGFHLAHLKWIVLDEADR